LDGLSSPEALFTRLASAAPGVTSLALRTGNAHDKIILPSVRVAREAFSSGHHLTLAGLEHSIPQIGEILRAIGAQIGAPSDANPRTLLYLSPKGKAAGMHYDANVNFVLQLRGRKRWRYAPNITKDVTHRHVVNDDRFAPELRLYIDRKPSTPPRAKQTFEVRGGDALFLPRSSWHATQALEESMALNFVFAQPPWADFVLAALRRRMLRKTAWRALRGSRRDRCPDRQRRFAAELDALLDDLREELTTLSAEALWQESKLHASGLFIDDEFRHRAGVRLTRKGRQLVVTEGKRSVTTITLGESFLPAVRFVIRARGEFSMGEVIDASAGLSLENLAHALEKLLDVGAIERVARGQRENP
jgi:hypothetical protein